MTDPQIVELLAALVTQGESQENLLESIDSRLADLNFGIATVSDGLGR